MRKTSGKNKNKTIKRKIFEKKSEKEKGESTAERHEPEGKPGAFPKIIGGERSTQGRPGNEAMDSHTWSGRKTDSSRPKPTPSDPPASSEP